MAASSLEQKLSRLEAKLKQENREARRRIDLNLDISPARARPIIVITLSPAPRSVPASSSAAAAGERRGGPGRAPRGHPAPAAPPPAPATCWGCPSRPSWCPRSVESIEIDQKLQEIMKQTGVPHRGGGSVTRQRSTTWRTWGEIGSGTCGQVWKMRFRKTGHVIAVKQMRRSGNREENKRILMDLDVVLKSHDCPYIVQCFGTFITNTDVFIAMELMGTCAEKLKKRIQGPIPERILGKMTIVKALFYLKEKHGVIHRDVKPSNILLDERGAGCAAYMAPERIDPPPTPPSPDYDIRADVWSLGISLVELATGQFPLPELQDGFRGADEGAAGGPPTSAPHHGLLWGTSRPSSGTALTKDHRKRPKYNKLLEHNFIKRLRDAGGGRGLLVQGRHGQDRVPSHRRWPSASTTCPSSPG
ncbi:unnamed protein product, partial [Bubo scandiacus]